MSNVERSTLNVATFNLPTFHLQHKPAKRATLVPNVATFNLQPSNVATFNLQRLTARSPNRMQTDQVLVLSSA